MKPLNVLYHLNADNTSQLKKILEKENERRISKLHIPPMTMEELFQKIMCKSNFGVARCFNDYELKCGWLTDEEHQERAKQIDEHAEKSVNEFCDYLDKKCKDNDEM